MNPYERRRRIQEVREQYERLLEEERRAPRESDGRDFWLVADALSGDGPRRERRKEDLTRDLFLLRRGYRLYHPMIGDPEFCRYVYLFTFDAPYRVVVTISRAAYEEERLHIWQRWVKLLLFQEGGQYHLCCRECQEPLLYRANQERALDYLHNHAYPSRLPRYYGFFATESYHEIIEQLTTHEYRRVADGPQSLPLTHCPECHALLEKSTVMAIRDGWDT